MTVWLVLVPRFAFRLKAKGFGLGRTLVSYRLRLASCQRKYDGDENAEAKAR